MATIIVYLCFVICTGVLIGRRSKKSAEGFYLGGRGIGPLVTAMSAEASDMSSWLLMGLPGVAYLSGVADASWTPSPSPLSSPSAIRKSGRSSCASHPW